MGEKRTVLHSKIDRIIGTVGKYSFILCVLIFVGMTARLVHTRIANRQNNMEMNNLDIFGAISYLFTYFFILIVMLVPISLSKGVDYMINYTIK